MSRILKAVLDLAAIVGFGFCGPGCSETIPSKNKDDSKLPQQRQHISEAVERKSVEFEDGCVVWDDDPSLADTRVQITATVTMASPLNKRKERWWIWIHCMPSTLQVRRNDDACSAMRILRTQGESRIKIEDVEYVRMFSQVDPSGDMELSAYAYGMEARIDRTRRVFVWSNPQGDGGEVPCESGNSYATKTMNLRDTREKEGVGSDAGSGG